MAAPARAFGRRDTIVLAACLVLSVVARALPEPVKEPVAASMRRTLVAPLVALQRDAELSRRAWLERDVVIRARDSVELRSMALTAMQQENEQLRRLLGLGQRLRWGFVPAEVLHGQTIGEENTIRLSAGSRAGVKPFSPVVSPDGLVGMVKTVDPGMSIAILWTHPDFRVSAMSADESAFGIAAAHLGVSSERNLMELRGVPLRSTLHPGTVVWSSGLGGVYPRGIPIGRVMGEDRRPVEGWARTYLLQPAVNPAALDAVMVLQPERGAAGVRGVWVTPQSVDSAVRRIVAAGDSLARRAAAESAAARTAGTAAEAGAPAVSDSARRAAADSVRRAAAARARRDSIRAARAAADSAAPARDTAAQRRDSVARRDSLARRDSTPRDTTRPPQP